MSETYILGIDGGNTKTLALVARPDGSIVGTASGRWANIYAARNEGAALTEIEETARAALAVAHVEFDAVDAVALSVAGADWPEDLALYRGELARRLELRRAPVVVNDAIGGLWAGAPTGVGVSVVCGTAGAVGGCGPDGLAWHAGFWIGSSGAIELVRRAVHAVNRAALGIDRSTSLTIDLPEFFGAATPEAMLQRLTRRAYAAADWSTVAAAAPVVLDAAKDGDATAHRIVAECGAELGDFALVAAREVGLLERRRPWPLVLSGGVVRHRSRLLVDGIVERVAASAPEARPLVAELPPAAGALRLALRDAGVAADERVSERMRASLVPRAGVLNAIRAPT